MIADDGLDYSPLLECKNLEEVSTEFMAPAEANDKVIAVLEKRGVTIR